MSQEGKKSGGSKKYGRNKRPVDQAMSAYVRGRIDFATYWRRVSGIKIDKVELSYG